MKRVLAVIVANPLRKVSGASTAGLSLSLATAELADIDVAAMWDANESVQEGPLRIQRFRCSTPAGPFSSLLPRVVRLAFTDSQIPQLIKAGQYDLVHIHNLFPLYAAERIVDACVRSRTPFVISTHGFFELSDYAGIYGYRGLKATAARWLVEQPFRRIVAKADALFCLSPADQDLLERLGFGNKPTRIVTNGVNEFYLRAAPPEQIAAMRAKLQLDSKQPTVLYMGSLHGYKGVDVFLDSLDQVTTPFQAVVGGHFNRPDTGERLLRDSRLRPELRNRVRFTGPLTDEELRALYQLADVFVYPTRADTLPLVVLEAMASGLPVISTTVGGIPFEVPPDCGVLTAAGDAQATSVAINRLLNNSGERQSMARAARARVESVFNWRKAAESAVAGYEEIWSEREQRQTVRA